MGGQRDPCEFEHGHMHPDVPEEPSAAVGTERGDLVGDLNCGNDLLGLRSG